MIPDPEVTECSEHEVKSKIGNIFVNGKILEEYSIKIDPYLKLKLILITRRQNRNIDRLNHSIKSK